MTCAWLNDGLVLRKRWVWVAASLALHGVVLAWLFSRGVSVNSSVRQTPLEFIFVEMAPPLSKTPPMKQAPKLQMPPSTDAKPARPIRPNVDVRPPQIPQDGFDTAIVTAPLMTETENAPLSEAVRQALANVFCSEMKESQRRQAECSDQANAADLRTVWASPSADTQNLIDEVYQRQLAETVRSENYIEQMIARNGNAPKTMFGNIAAAGPLDNTAFMKRRDKGVANRHRIAAGQTSSWEADIRRAHGQ